MKALGGLWCMRFFCFLLLIFGGEVFGGQRRSQNRGGKRLQKDHHDALKLARCDAKCWILQKAPKAECVKKCLLQEKKPGLCNAVEEMNPWEAVCLSACKSDAHCPDVLKCCPNRCGTTCQHPRGLHHVIGLPSIPQSVSVREKRRGLTVRIEWISPDQQKQPVLYVIEERNHVGKNLGEALFGEWTPQYRSLKINVTLKNVVKPGRWYQFRVAAVNENGTKGFSKPSSHFTPSHGPRPPSTPRNLTVDTLQYQNGTLNGIFKWKPPSSSDLPIQKYKVYWSRRLQGVDQELNSILVKHHSVRKDQTYFEIKGLEPRSQYFLQVQAISQFGAIRLKSEKSAIVINTTNYSNDSVIPSEGNSSKRSAEHKIEGLQVQKMYWSKNQLSARLVWKPSRIRSTKNIRYSVQWWTTSCDIENDDFKVRKQTTVLTDMPRTELYDLHFSCKYNINVIRISNGDNYSSRAMISFTTPSCQQFQLKTKKEKIKCN
ncbi:anosmin-1-like [Arctopsyche grandis]|uniref:anosmin-1-like n=1 Tax=Arctopsyche grandis TaxID=121162 RepID=UPI00406DA26C